jgi:ligand-binding sensor domain-containing protein/signal transduction histidine kinase
MNIFNRASRWLTLPSALAGLGWLLCCLACWLACLAPANASQRWEMLSDPAFQHISSEQGLPHGFISSMIQDNAGFLWIATTNGLTRWDGYRFRTYKPQINDNNSISDIVILALHIDPHGRMWIGTATGGLLRYETAQDNFTRFAIGPGGLSHPSVTSICDDGSGGLWLATGAGLNHLEAGSDRITQMPRNDAKFGELPESRLRSVLRTQDGSVWVGSPKGLLHRPPGSLRFNPVKLTHPAGTPETATQAIGINTLFEAGDNRLWIGTNNSGAFWYDFKDKQIHSLREINSNDPQIATDPVLAILEPHPGQMWFATLGRGILVLHSGSNETSRIVHNPMVPNSLSSNSVFSLLLDRSGLIWAGTNRSLEHINSNNQAVQTLFGIENHTTKISNPTVRSILSLPNGTIWLGLFNNGIDIIHPERGRIKALRPDLKHPETALQDDRVWALLPVNNTVYIGTDHGLYRAKADGSDLERVKLPGPPVDNIRKLLLKGNDLYIGSQDGLFVLDLSGAAPLPRIRPKGAEKLSDTHIGSMVHGPDGSIWIGTRNGLNQYDPASHSLRMFLPNSKSGKGLAPGSITSLLFDRQGRLWIGTIGSGISVMTHNGKDATFQRLGVFDGLPNDAINCMQTDDKGNIWISTDDGVAEVDPEQLQVRAIGRADGVVLSTYLSGSCHTTNQGELLFGGIGGLTVLQPRLLQKWHFQPTLVVSEIRIGGKTVPASRFNQGTHTPTLMIPPNADSLSLEFSALDFSAPELNRYAYQLEGYDTDWIDTDPSRRLAVYTRLPPGDYRLRLRGSNRSGEWIGEELILPLHVTASWYQTWWFHALELLAVLGLILAIIHIRTRYLQQNRKQLALQVAERTSELEQKQQELVRANQDLNNANDELAQSANTLRELDHIGRDITANLDLQTAFETVHQHVMRLLDAPSLIILRFNPELNQLELAFGREHGQPVASQGNIPLQSSFSNNARTARERHEILIEVTPDPGNAQATRTSRKLMTALYVPLIVDHRLLGVMSMQSGLPQAYGPRERLIFRNLCAYTAIALDNANAYHRLQEAQEKLVEQEKLAALGALVAGVAHELNTPIGNSILMLSSMQSKTSEFGAKVNDGQLRRSELEGYLEDANEASRVIMRGLSSAADLVASFKQVAVDRTTAHQRPFNLANTSNEIIATMMNRIKLAGHQIELKMADDITLNSYPGPYGQVIANLINNALLHAFENQVQGRMWLSARKEGSDRVLIEFHDNGKGIAPDHLKRIFDPFFTTKMGQGGSGLGLSISYNIVTSLLNGSIRVESTPGKGTSFIMDLPLKAPLR